jgi:hypothetical protein
MVRPRSAPSCAHAPAKRTWRRDVRSVFSYLSASDPRVHVGLGAATTVDAVEVTWPGGAVERFGPFAADAVVELRQTTGRSGGRTATAPR